MIIKQSAQSIRNASRYYTTLPSDVLKSIKSADALAIWAYLLSQSRNFVIRPAHIQEHLDIGEVRYGKAMRILRELGLVDTAQVRDASGKIAGNELVCFDSPASEHPENPDSGKSRNPVNQESGFSSPLIKDQETNQVSTGNQVSKLADEPQTEGRTVATWHAYSNAYFDRYQTEPVRNRSVNGMLAKLVDALGGEAPHVAAFYVRHDDFVYVRQCHPVNLLLRDATGLRTQWAKNKAITGRDARQIEKRAGIGMGDLLDNALGDMEAKF